MNRKFKHKQSGEVITEMPCTGMTIMYEDRFKGQIFAMYVHGCGDWEEIIDKPEYIILEFSTAGEDFHPILNDSNRYIGNGTKAQIVHINYLLAGVKNGSAVIEKVKREIDGEVFTIGDHIELLANGNLIIDKIHLVTAINTIYLCGMNKAFNGYNSTFDLNVAQKVKPKEWEIGEWKSIGGEDVEILTIKRFSDSAIFKIGDKFTNNDTGKKKYTIDSIQIDKSDEYGDIEFICNGYSFPAQYCNLVKKEFLFTTEDGKEIFEGDKAWFVPFSIKTGNGCKAFQSVDKADKDWKNGKIFFHLFKAAEYVDFLKSDTIMNKPCLSIRDVNSSLRWDNAGYIDMNSTEICLKELVKSKL